MGDSLMGVGEGIAVGDGWMGVEEAGLVGVGRDLIADSERGVTSMVWRATFSGLTTGRN